MEQRITITVDEQRGRLLVPAEFAADVHAALAVETEDAEHELAPLAQDSEGALIVTRNHIGPIIIGLKKMWQESVEANDTERAAHIRRLGFSIGGYALRLVLDPEQLHVWAGRERLNHIRGQ